MKNRQIVNIWNWSCSCERGGGPARKRRRGFGAGTEPARSRGGSGGSPCRREIVGSCPLSVLGRPRAGHLHASDGSTSTWVSTPSETCQRDDSIRDETAICQSVGAIGAQPRVKPGGRGEDPDPGGLKGRRKPSGTPSGCGRRRGRRESRRFTPGWVPATLRAAGGRPLGLGLGSTSRLAPRACATQPRGALDRQSSIE